MYIISISLESYPFQRFINPASVICVFLITKLKTLVCRKNEPQYSYGDAGCNIRKNYPWARGK